MSSKGDATREHILATAEGLILDRGFVGTPLDDILLASDLTKGAFFYHFKNKAELARALVERYWKNDSRLFEDCFARAGQLSDEPLESLLMALKLFGETIENLDSPPSGCLFASFTYESYQFDEGIHDFIRSGFAEWNELIASRLRRIFEKHAPSRETSPEEVAETIMCVIEGAFILVKSTGDSMILVRQVEALRASLRSLFSQSTGGSAP